MKQLLTFALLALLFAGCSKSNDIETETYSISFLELESGVSIYNNDPIDISTNENNDIQKVEFYFDGNLVGSDITSPFSISWTPENIPFGTFQLTSIGYINSIEVARCSIDINVKLRLGDSFQGGKIFSLDENGHGLIATTSDLVVNNSYLFTYGGYGQNIGATDLNDGTANTAAICAVIQESNNAAVACSNLAIDGYRDWYLPAESEIKLLKTNQNYVGGFSTNSDVARYWSSTELDSNTARAANFVALMGTNIDKRINYRVRAIRKF